MHTVTQDGVMAQELGLGIYVEVVFDLESVLDGLNLFEILGKVGLNVKRWVSLRVVAKLVQQFLGTTESETR